MCGSIDIPLIRDVVRIKAMLAVHNTVTFLEAYLGLAIVPWLLSLDVVLGVVAAAASLFPVPRPHWPEPPLRARPPPPRLNPPRPLDRVPRRWGASLPEIKVALKD